MYFPFEFVDRVRLAGHAHTLCLKSPQTSLSESYNYRHLRTATNVSTIIHISTKAPARTRKNSPTTQLSAPPPRILKAQRPPPRSWSPQGSLYMDSVPARQLSWPQSTAVSPHRPYLPERVVAAGTHHPLKG